MPDATGRASNHALGAEHPFGAAMAGTALIGAGVGLGAWVTAQGARRTGELQLDQLIAAHRQPGGIWLSHAADQGLGPVVGPILLALVCLIVGARNRVAAMVLGGVAIVGWFSVGLGKVVFARHRPPADQVHALVHESGLDSYPSGHTAFAAAVLAGVIMALRSSGRETSLAWYLGVPAVLLVAGTRLYLGAHHLADVVGSVLFVAGTVLVLAASITWASARLPRIAHK